MFLEETLIDENNYYIDENFEDSDFEDSFEEIDEMVEE